MLGGALRHVVAVGAGVGGVWLAVLVDDRVVDVRSGDSGHHGGDGAGVDEAADGG